MASHDLDVIYRRFGCNVIKKMDTQHKNSKMQLMVLNNLSDQRSQIAKNINVILKSWGLHTSVNIEEMCTMQYKCTIYSSEQEATFVVQMIKDFNNIISLFTHFKNTS